MPGFAMGRVGARFQARGGGFFKLTGAGVVAAVVAVAGAPLSAAKQPLTPAADGNAVTSVLNIEGPLHASHGVLTSQPATNSGVDVAALIGADRFYNAGYDGTGAVASNVEAGHLWAGHSALGHVSTFVDDPATPSSPFVSPVTDRHATWVAQALGGRGGNALREGIAPGAELRSGAIADTWTGDAYSLNFTFTTDSLDTAYNTGATGYSGVDVINSSWSSEDDSGSTGLTGLFDGLAFANPQTTHVFSAGNTGVGKVRGPASGYNTIAVGALENDGANNYDAVASFSSRGPNDYEDPFNGTTSDVRAAIDLVAPGTDLVLAFYGGQSGGNDPSLTDSTDDGGDGFTYSAGLSGTSFAAPIVAGVATLMNDAAVDRGLPLTATDSRVIKANLQNAADKIPGWDNGQADVGGVQTTAQSLDYASGAGALNADATFDQFLTGETDIAGDTGGVSTRAHGWDFASVDATAGSSTDIVLPMQFLGGTEFTATLTWFRDRERLSSTQVQDNAFADLDLQIWDSTFTTLLAESNSQYNNVEHLHFVLDQDTTIGLRADFFGMNFDGVDTSAVDFALAWEGQLVPAPGTGLAMLLVGGLVLGRRGRSA